MTSETFRELYRWQDGRELSLEGTVLTLYEGVSPLGEAETVRRVAELLQKTEPFQPPASGETPVSPSPGTASPPPAAPQMSGPLPELTVPNIELRESDEGPAITLHNLNFKADSAELLESEVPRLEVLARALLSLPGKTFLVVGHSAGTGKPQGEKQLSIERARAVSEALQKRGVPADRLIYEGRGSSQPIAPNTDAAGRERNRRVEIIILD